MPRQGVFYTGYRYVGPFLRKDVQKLYLKRKGVKHGERWWAMITHGKYDEYSKKFKKIEKKWLNISLFGKQKPIPYARNSRSIVCGPESYLNHRLKQFIVKYRASKTESLNWRECS